MNNAKKIKSHNLKSTNVLSNNNRNNMTNQTSSQYNLASHKLNNVINPFAATAKTQNQIQKKLNLIIILVNFRIIIKKCLLIIL